MKKTKRAAVREGISTEAGANQEMGILIGLALPEHSRRTRKAQQMLTGGGMHWLFQQVRGALFQV
jgi:hypothetical protein